MFKLFKLAVFGFIGYSLYQLFMQSGDGNEDSGRDLRGSANRSDAGRLGTLSGVGRGTIATTEDASGMSAPHIVGRGVRF